jgi:hypothetical protein
MGTSKKINNAQSFFQSGGITAGEINMNISHQKPERKLDGLTKKNILDFVEEAQTLFKPLEIIYYGCARETYAFFIEVTDFLNDAKVQYKPSNIAMVFGFPLPQGTNFLKCENIYTIEIGEL